MYDLTNLVPSLMTIIVSVTLAAFASYQASKNNEAEKDALVRSELAAVRTSIDNLAKSVDKHNHFAERMPVVEQQVSDLKRDTEDIFNRLRKMEMGGKQ